jgi:hypothetical protein
MTYPSDAGRMSPGHLLRRAAAMLSSALLVAALFAACGPSGQSPTPATNQHATASTSAAASPLGSGSQPAASNAAASPAATSQPSGVAASSPDPLGSDLSNLDQLLNGMDDSLSQAGPSASGE